MGTLCIIRGFPQRTSHKGSFVNAHEDYLAGEKILIDGYHPHYQYCGRELAYFYSTQPILGKLARLLPELLYRRWFETRRYTTTRLLDALKAFFTQHNVDVVLAEFGNVGADICQYTEELGIPLIVHFHGHDAHRTSVVNEYRDKYRRMFASAFRIVTVSQFMTRTLVELGADPAKITLNPYGPQACFMENQSSYDPVLVGIGRFTDIKAPHLTLLAFEKVVRQIPEAKLIFGGHGELLEACQSLAETMGLGNHVQFTGALEHEDVVSHFRTARCFVQHSVIPGYGDAEGCPVAILEAQAAGLPVVATRHAGIVDSVVNGVTGFLVEERDVDGMADHMIRLLTDMPLAVEMGQNARKHIRDNFSIEKHIRCLDQVIAAARRQQ
ncbi:MAG: glycosyltransferase family 4 protein [Planctomycetaceae bacterium]|nr:glycosyltransferase family 4 protein [Planctomycetaceae bacterium]